MASDPFAAVIGHRTVCELLRREASQPVHAYLFIGAAGVGKATLARGFAKLLLCPQLCEHEAPCRSCRRMDSGNHPDLVAVEPEGKTSIGVEQARSVAAQAALAPVESARRVFLFEEAGLMTEQAANALLKTLEEPLARLVIILVAESEDEFPATVASRCRTIHLGRVPEEELVTALVGRGLSSEQARASALVAGGRPGLALSLATRPEVAGFRQAWLGVAGRLTSRPGDAYRLAEEMLESVEPLLPEDRPDETADRRERSRKRASQALVAGGLEILASWYADAASLQLGGPLRNRDVPFVEYTRIGPRAAVANAESILNAVIDLQANLRPQLLLASLFASLAGAEDA